MRYSSLRFLFYVVILVYKFLCDTEGENEIRRVAVYFTGFGLRRGGRLTIFPINGKC